MAKKYDRDLLFVFKALLIACVVMAGLFVLKAFLPPSPGALKTAEILRTLARVEPRDMPALLHSGNGKPVMLVVYASWCGTCRATLPIIVGMMKTGEMDGIEPRFVSIDSRPDRLARYLAQNRYDEAFTPYIADPHDGQAALKAAIAAAGGNYEGYIPYAAFLRPDGRVAADYTGGMRRNLLRKMAAQARVE